MKEKRRGKTRGQRIMLCVAVILLISGLCVLFYPTVVNLAYQSEVSKIKEDFLKNIARQEGESQTLPDTQFDRLYAFLQEENRKLFENGQSGLTDAFSYEQPAVDFSEYGLTDNCIGFISIPRIGQELPIYLGASRANMKKGAVHLTQTSYPIGGGNTNCVIAAHRGGTQTMFRNIHKIQIGDRITITNFRETLTYQAVEIKIIKPNEIDQILIQEGRDLLTLISCNPLGYNYQRYVLYCERVT